MAEAKIRIIEFGEDSYFSQLFPESCQYFFTSYSKGRMRKSKHAPTWKQAFELFSALGRKEYGLVVYSSFRRCLWNRNRSLGGNVLSVFKHLLTPKSLIPYIALRIARKAGVVVVAYDMLDTMLITSENHFLFPYIRKYFKRELPQNRWQVFLSTTSRNGDVSNIRRQEFYRDAMSKICPLPLNARAEAFPFVPIDAGRKTSDIFYVGENEKTTVRSDGMKLLAKMKELGIRVDMPEERLDGEEFKRRLAASWLAWSPEGSGWDCFRHQESLMCGAVPVINYPTIYRYRPLVDGVHVFFYGCEGEGLIDVVVRALKDKPKLLEMVAAGRDHLLRWNTRESVRSYVLSESGREES
jgi:hypothetical protein